MTAHRTLIVANRTAATALLLEEVERRAAEQPSAFVLLIPEVSSRQHADWTLEEALKALRKAASGHAGLRAVDMQGRVGGADALESIRVALTDGDFDDVLISTLSTRRSRWLRQDLPQRVQKLGVPVTVITQPDTPRMTLKDLTETGGFGGIA